MNTVTTNEIIYTNKELESIIGKIIIEKLNRICNPYKPLSDYEISVSDIAFMIHTDKKAVVNVLECVAISEKQDKFESLIYSDQKIYEAVKNLFCDNKIELILYKNVKYKYGAEYRVEVARLNDIYQSMVQVVILPKRHSSKKYHLSMRVKYETFAVLSQKAQKDNKSIAEVIDNLVRDSIRVCTQTRGISDMVNNISGCNDTVMRNDNATNNATNNTTNHDDNTTNHDDSITNRITNTQSRILEEILNEPKITSKELAKIIGVHTVSIKKNLAILKQQGLIKRIGNNRSGYWKIIKNDLSNIH